MCVWCLQRGCVWLPVLATVKFLRFRIVKRVEGFGGHRSHQNAVQTRNAFRHLLCKQVTNWYSLPGLKSTFWDVGQTNPTPFSNTEHSYLHPFGALQRHVTHLHLLTFVHLPRTCFQRNLVMDDAVTVSVIQEERVPLPTS